MVDTCLRNLRNFGELGGLSIKHPSTYMIAPTDTTLRKTKQGGGCWSTWDTLQTSALFHWTLAPTRPTLVEPPELEEWPTL